MEQHILTPVSLSKTAAAGVSDFSFAGKGLGRFGHPHLPVPNRMNEDLVV